MQVDKIVEEVNHMDCFLNRVGQGTSSNNIVAVNRRPSHMLDIAIEVRPSNTSSVTNLIV